MFGSETQIDSVLLISRLPNLLPKWIYPVIFAGVKDVHFANIPVGSKFWVAAWVDPNVLEACGIDSKIYSGYALGMGIERVTNLKYKVKDLRMFSENDVRFLEEFESAH